MVNAENAERAVKIKKFNCEKCRFGCSKQSDFNRHLMTAKHQMITDGNKKVTNDNKKTPPVYKCECGQQYKFLSGLSRHKRKCIYNTSLSVENTPKQTIKSPSTEAIDVIREENTELKTMLKDLIQHTQTQQSDQELKSILKDLIQHTHEEQTQSKKSNQEFQTQTLQNNQEFQTMMLNLFKECMQKSAEMAPSVGNNNTITNSNNINNINYYLNVTCKDAETDLDFLEQWKERCIELFHEKKLLMAERKISFPNMCTDAYFTQIKSKPQTQRFIQTTNWKDGRVYVNTAKLDEDKNPTGESEFILHEDGLKEVNNHMSHALGQSILKLANKEVEEKYFEENRKFNIFSRQPTTPEIEWKRDMTGGLMIGTSEVFNVCCSSTSRTKIMKETHKALR